MGVRRCMSNSPADHSSPGSEAWTSDSSGPGSDTSSSQRSMSTAEQSSLPDSPESTSTKTSKMSQGLVSGVPTSTRIYDARTDLAPTLQAQKSENRGGTTSPMILTTFGVSENQRGELRLTPYSRQLTTGGGKPGQGYPAVLISSAEDSPAKTSASPASAPASQESAADSSSSSCESLTLFVPEPSSLKTSKGSTALEALRAQTSGSSSTRWPSAGIWRRGELLTRSTSGCRNEGSACSCAPSLTEILEPNASEKYSLSQKAATGILRRATRRGRSLPPQLEEALKAVAGESWAHSQDAT